MLNSINGDRKLIDERLRRIYVCDLKDYELKWLDDCVGKFRNEKLTLDEILMNLKLVVKRKTYLGGNIIYTGECVKQTNQSIFEISKTVSKIDEEIKHALDSNETKVLLEKNKMLMEEKKMLMDRKKILMEKKEDING